MSPDPTCDGEVRDIANNIQAMDIHPCRLIEASPMSAPISRWARQLDRRRPAPLTVRCGHDGRFELLVDYGTEIDAQLELDVTTEGLANVMVYFGEFLPEAQGMVFGHCPDQRIAWHIASAGRNSHSFPQRGFRFVRIIFNDIQGALTLNGLAAHCQFTFQDRPGDMSCSDQRFQRVWQTSVYTARLCTKPDTFWDGIKRDRHGWYGDARITKETCDNVFFDPRPSEPMLLALPTGEWANTIPTYSFDAIMMFAQHILAYGLGRKCIPDIYARMKQMLAWVLRTQTDANGFIKRTDRHYFGGTGFIDWSLMPQGGRMEELCCLQAKYVEGLRCAARIARWLGKTADANRWQGQADKLSAKVVRRFWRDGSGFIHTLNHIGPVENPYLPAHVFKQHELTYRDKIRLGPSGPTRQSNALAVWAGLADQNMKRAILQNVFQNDRIPMVITPYFAYYEQSARAMCGDANGAIMHLRNYIGEILEKEDAATVWEAWDPQLTDYRKYSSHRDINWEWPLSACHAWGSGTVGVAARYLFGIESLEPGYAAITLHPDLNCSWAYEATVPTPFGTIQVSQSKPGGAVRYRVPRQIRVQAQPDTPRVKVQAV
jgi:hypothetical protein